jgi:hypothetical protein
MAANERETGTPEETDPIRAYAIQNTVQDVAKPRSPVIPFLISALATAAILAAAFYLWGR